MDYSDDKELAEYYANDIADEPELLSECCGAPMDGEEFNNLDSPIVEGWCSDCKEASSFTDEI